MMVEVDLLGLIGQYKYVQRLDNTSHIFEGTYAMYGYNWYVCRRLKTGLTESSSSTISIGNNSTSSSSSSKSSKGDGYSQTITLANGRTHKLYKQGAGSWAGKHYNSVSNTASKGTYGNCGCGPSAVAIALSAYNSSITPYTVGRLCMKNKVPSNFDSLQKATKQLRI